MLGFVVYAGIPQNSFDIVASYDLSSDHSPIIINYRVVTFEQAVNANIFTPKTDIQSFQYWIEKHINLNVPIKTPTELDEAVETLTKLIHEAAFLSTPQQIYHDFPNFRVSYEIRQLIRKKRRLRKIWQRTRRPADKTNFNRASNELKKLLKDHKN